MNKNKGSLEIVRYTPEEMCIVEENAMEDFREDVLYLINLAMGPYRKENVRVAVDRIVYMLRNNYEDVALEFLILNDNASVGKVRFLNEAGERVRIDTLVNRMNAGI